MVENIQREILLDIVFGIDSGLSELNILQKAVPVFLKKLNCIAVTVFKTEGQELKDSITIPLAYKGTDLWLSSRTLLEGIENPQNIIEFCLEGKDLTAYPLNGYGFIVFTRKSFFDMVFKQELRQVANYLANSLLGAIRDKKRTENERYLLILQDFINHFTDAVQVSYESGQLFYINQIASERLGIKPEDCQDYKVSDFEAIFKNNDFWLQHIEELKQTPSVVIEGVNTNQTTGEVFPVEVTARYVRIDNTGFVIANSRDITERKKADAIIQQQVEMQRILLDISSKYINIDLKEVNIAIIESLRELGKYVGADRAYIFNYNFYSNTVSNTVEWCEEGILHEQERLQNIPLDNISSWLEKHNQGKEFYIPNVPSYLKANKGKVIKHSLASQNIQSLITFPLISGGELLGFVGFDSIKTNHDYSEKEKTILVLFAYMLVNIKQRRRKEEQLQLQEFKYRNIIENMNLGLLEVDENERILYCNSSFSTISGYAPNEIIGKKASELFISDQDADIIQDKIKMRNDNESDSYSILVRNKRGEAKWWLVSGAPNYDEKGRVIGSIGIHLDITNQKKLESDLEAALVNAQSASLAKAAFLANMSHEIRTPLNGIIGLVREIAKEPGLTPKVQSYVGSARKASNHLLSIINNILDISKIEAGELKLEPHEFRSKDLLHDIKQILDYLSQEKGLDLIVDIDENVKEVLVGDQARIRQVILNLAGNAIKFTEKGTVSIKLCATSTNKYHQSLLFTVKDTGMGMDEAFIKNAFKKFQQEDASISRRFGGSGLGLVITKELVELMNGKIDIISHKGIGTEISVHLTLTIGDEKNITARESINQLRTLEDKSILLVEDNELNRLVVINALQPLKVKVTEAENGQEAINCLKNESFDLVLMDIQMPIMGGIESTTIIRRDLSLHLPIIGLSANAFKSEIDTCLKVGMNDYITKPFEERDLWRLLYKYLDNNTFKPIALDNDERQQTGKVSYSLDKLKDMSRGNDEFVTKMIRLFTQIVPDTCSIIEKGIEKQDVALVKGQLHKLKPSLSYLASTELLNDVIEIEQLQTTEDTFITFATKVKRVIITLNSLVDILNTNELNT